MILIFNLPPNKDAFTLQTLLLWYLIVCPFSLMICGSQGKFSSVEASGCNSSKHENFGQENFTVVLPVGS